MMKSNRTRELYKCTLQQKAVQDILKAFTTQEETLDLGDRAKLNHRGTNLLLDLIKASELVEIKFGDCVLKSTDIQQIRKFLLEQSDSLCFKKTSFGIEGILLLKAVLKKKSTSKLSLPNCELNLSQLRHVFSGLQDMTADNMNDLDLRGNSIGKEGINMIMQFISTKNLKKLTLAHCYITAVQLKLLSEGINVMKGTMDIIDLRGNMISKKDIEFFKKTVENKIVEVSFY